MSLFGWQQSTNNNEAVDKDQISFVVNGVTALLTHFDELTETVKALNKKIVGIEASVQECVKGSITSRSSGNVPNDNSNSSSRKQVTVYFSKQFTADALDILKDYNFLRELR
jgi:hypothetical protein